MALLKVQTQMYSKIMDTIFSQKVSFPILVHMHEISIGNHMISSAILIKVTANLLGCLPGDLS